MRTRSARSMSSMAFSTASQASSGTSEPHTSSSTVSPGRLELPFIYIQWGQEVMLFPRIEARKLIALQALLALLQHMRPRPPLKRLGQDHGTALSKLR